MIDTYEAPLVELDAATSHEENHPAWFVVPLAVASYFGGMWAWCRAMCWGNGGVQSCSAQYMVNVKVVCKD